MYHRGKWMICFLDVLKNWIIGSKSDLRPPRKWLEPLKRNKLLYKIILHNFYQLIWIGVRKRYRFDTRKSRNRNPDFKKETDIRIRPNTRIQIQIWSVKYIFFGRGRSQLSSFILPTPFLFVHQDVFLMQTLSQTMGRIKKHILLLELCTFIFDTRSQKNHIITNKSNKSK